MWRRIFVGAGSGGTPCHHCHPTANLAGLDADGFLYVGPRSLSDAELGSFEQHAYLGQRPVQALLGLVVSAKLHDLRGCTDYAP